MKKIIFLLLGFLITLSYTTSVYAEVKVSPNLEVVINGKKIPMNAEKIEKLEKMINENNASWSEVLKTIAPEYWKSLSSTEKQTFQKMKFQSEIKEGSNKIVRGKLYLKPTQLNSYDRTTYLKTPTPLLLAGQSDMSPSPNLPIIEYSADTRVVLPPYFNVAYISAGATLNRKISDSDSEMVAFVCTSATYKSYIEAVSNYYVIKPGYYRVIGTHAVEDPRCLPSSWTGISYTDWEYVNT
jgi:hypothetical protein